MVVFYKILLYEKLSKANKILTLVIPIAPIFSLYDVVPLPDPQAPVKRQPNPSIPRPLFIACFGGVGAPESLAHAK